MIETVATIAVQGFFIAALSLAVIKHVFQIHRPVPWPEAEPVIARNPECAYWYAVKVLKGPFLAAEPTIAKNSEWAFKYSRDVLKTLEDRNRFKELNNS